jgi:hypothetical protein
MAWHGVIPARGAGAPIHREKNTGRGPSSSAHWRRRARGEPRPGPRSTRASAERSALRPHASGPWRRVLRLARVPAAFSARRRDRRDDRRRRNDARRGRPRPRRRAGTGAPSIDCKTAQRPSPDRRSGATSSFSAKVESGTAKQALARGARRLPVLQCADETDAPPALVQAIAVGCQELTAPRKMSASRKETRSCHGSVIQWCCLTVD